ncbi:hypothetical protein, partial [Bacillus thuringiensis]|uniref:hypothetical protein n=1 Tax=Bacillus thuringiensis TaxID=1428 RepID=UPI001C92FC94
MKRLIEKQDISNLQLIQQLPQLYKLFYITNPQLLTKQHYHQNLTPLIPTLTTTSIQLQIFLQFPFIYPYLHLAHFKLVHHYTQTLNNLIPTLK